MQEMRSRYSCDNCGFKTTSETVLKLHKSTNHETNKQTQQIRTKRKQCEHCDKKFNKDSTLNEHKQKIHKLSK